MIKTKIGLVVQGDVLTEITSNEEYVKKFNLVSHRLDIVLACRVAPK